MTIIIFTVVFYLNILVGASQDVIINVVKFNKLKSTSYSTCGLLNRIKFKLTFKLYTLVLMDYLNVNM